MLQSIRERTQGWIAGVIISVIILSFALWGIHSYFVSGGNDSIIAEVNGIQITKEQLAVAYERLRRQAQVQLGSNSVSAKDEAALKLKAIQALTEIEALKQASLSQGYYVSNRQIDNYLQNIPDFQVDGRFSVERFQEIISSSLLSTGDFLEIIKTSLLIDQPKLGTLFTSFALPDEVNYTYSLVNQERAIEYLIIPFQSFLSHPNNIVTKQQIETYYNQHQRDFMTPEQAAIEYVELSFQDLLKTIQPNNAVLINFYNENINSYTLPVGWKLTSLFIPFSNSEENAKKQLETIIQLLEKGEEFSKLKTQYPDKTFNDQNIITLHQIPAEFQKIVTELTKNKPYAVIKTKQGFIVIKMLAMQEPRVQSFETVKDKVKDTYLHQRAEEKFADLREKLANLTYEHPDSLQFAAKTLNLSIKTSELFTKDKGGKDISQYKKVRDIAFSNDVLSLQNNSDVIQLHPESLIVLRIKSHVQPTLLPLQSITKQIEDKIKQDQAKNYAEKFVQELKNNLEIGNNTNQLLASYHLNWNKTDYLSRYSTKVDSAILDVAFRLPNPADTQNKKNVYGITRLPNGYAIVVLKSLKNVKITDPKQYAVFADQVQNSEGLLEYELYKQNELNSAKIKLMTE